MKQSPPACDLHLHSSYSDGLRTPAELVRMGADAGLAALSITDHDCVLGQKEALEAGARHGIEVATGVEFSVEEGGRSLHILGYLFDHRDADLLGSLDSLRRSREERAIEIVEKLRGAGIPLSADEVLSFAGKGTVGRPHIAKLLLERGLVSHFQEAFGRYLAAGRSAYVPKRVLPTERVIELIAGAGGIAVWAHPGADIGDEGLLGRLIGLGVGGVEVWHPNHDDATARRVLRAARRHGLVCTGGSDFHFEEAMVAAVGEIRVPLASLVELKRRRALSDLA